MSRCRIVFAVNTKNTAELQAIRSYRVESGPNPQFTILQAARATMASSDLLSPVHIGKQTFAAHFTNPINSVLKEAGEAFDERTKVACILSLGSGTDIIKGLPHNPRPNDRINMLASVAANCETAHCEAASRYRQTGIYYRINVERDYLYTTNDDEWEDGVTCISQATQTHLQVKVKSFERVVNRFVRHIGGPKIRDLSAFCPHPSISNALITHNRPHIYPRNGVSTPSGP